jgi:hypothetical protein
MQNQKTPHLPELAKVTKVGDDEDYVQREDEDEDDDDDDDDDDDADEKMAGNKGISNSKDQ